MATSYIFSDPTLNLLISPFSIYVLLERGDNLKNREILKKIEKRKTISGNIFSVRAVRKDLVVGGGSRKILKDALGNANIIAEVLNPGSSVPEYLYTQIDYNPENIEQTANQIRQFIKDLCERDVEALKSNRNTYLISAKKELIQQLTTLEDYLTREIIKSGHTLDKRISKKSTEKDIKTIPSNFRNGLPENLNGDILIGIRPVSSTVAEPDYYQERDLTEDKISIDKKSFLKVLSELGWSYEYFKDKMRKASEGSIINIKDTSLRFTSTNVPKSRYPGLELEINNHKTITIKIGTKAGCLLYGSILFSLYEGKQFKRSDLSDVANQIKKIYKEKGRTALSTEDKKAIPLLCWFEGIYKAVLGKNNGTFLDWCIEEYNVTGLNTAATLLKDNIEDVLSDDLSEFKDLLLIQKKAQRKGKSKLPQQLYWIDFPIDQVEFPDDKWGDLKRKVASPLKL